MPRPGQHRRATGVLEVWAETLQDYGQVGTARDGTAQHPISWPLHTANRALYLGRLWA